MYLRAHDATVRDLEGWLDLRQSALNALIDIIVQGRGTLSQSKRRHKLFEQLTDGKIARIEATVSEHFRPYFDSRAQDTARPQSRLTNRRSTRGLPQHDADVVQADERDGGECGWPHASVRSELAALHAGQRGC